MKIVHLVASDRGGAYRAAIRINAALNNSGYESSILVLSKKNNDNKVFTILPNFISRVYGKILYLIKGFIQTNEFYESRYGIDVTKNKIIKQADIVNIHWVNNGYLSYSTLKKLLKEKKVVWTLHDTFAFTAGCYYPGSCTGFIEQCESCTLFSSMQEQKKVEKCYWLKKECYKDNKFTIIGCSHWMEEQAKRSTLCRNMKSYTVPNPIDTSVFFPIKKEYAKKELGLPITKKVVLFGAISGETDLRKGYDLLQKAAGLLNREEYVFAVFGNRESPTLLADHKPIGFGVIQDDLKLALLYSAADVFVAPSREENLSNTVMESLACGTPVVAFNVGGMPDLIITNYTGYLANPFNIEELALGIKTVANDNLELGINAHKYVVDFFSYSCIARQYGNIYKKMLEVP